MVSVEAGQRDSKMMGLWVIACVDFSGSSGASLDGGVFKLVKVQMLESRNWGLVNSRRASRG